MHVAPMSLPFEPGSSALSYTRSSLWTHHCEVLISTTKIEVTPGGVPWPRSGTSGASGEHLDVTPSCLGSTINYNLYVSIKRAHPLSLWTSAHGAEHWGLVCALMRV